MFKSSERNEELSPLAFLVPLSYPLPDFSPGGDSSPSKIARFQEEFLAIQHVLPLLDPPSLHYFLYQERFFSFQVEISTEGLVCPITFSADVPPRYR